MQSYDMFTSKAKQALALAQDAAKSVGHNYVGSEHVLIGLISEGTSLAAYVLESLGVTQEAVQEGADNIVGRGNYQFTDAFGYTPRTKHVLELSLYEAKSRNSEFIDTEHILLALIRDTNGVAAKILLDMGITAVTNLCDVGLTNYGIN